MKTRTHEEVMSPPATAKTGGRIDLRWAWHYRQLIALRERLARETDAKLHEVAEPVEPHSLHAGDSATDEFDHDVALTLLAAEQNSLNEVCDAIARIEKGTYGICEATGARIPAARLRALPWCRFARDVEQRLEKAGVVQRAHLPPVASLRGTRPEIPAGGELPREGVAEEPEEEPEETKSARLIAEAAGEAEEEAEGPERAR